jgi:hypothetical protein
MADPKVKKKTTTDAMESILPIVIPYAAKKLINLVPTGSKVEDFFIEYRSHWEKVAPVLATFIRGITNAPDLVDDIVSELSAEVARAIKEKYSDGEHLKDLSAEKGSTKNFSIAYAMDMMTKSKLVIFTGLLKSLPEEQRKNVLKYEIGTKDETKKCVNTLAQLTSDQLKDWADVMVPVKTPKPDSEFEKAAKKGLKNFSSDTRKLFKKDSYFTRIAKQKGLM